MLVIPSHHGCIVKNIVAWLNFYTPVEIHIVVQDIIILGQTFLFINRYPGKIGYFVSACESSIERDIFIVQSPPGGNRMYGDVTTEHIL